MKKFLAYICIIIILSVLAVKYGYNFAKDKVQANAGLNQVENIVVEDDEKENKVNNVVNEVETPKENIVKENKVEETVVTEQNTGAEVYEEKSDLGSTDKKQEAINMVKQKWGEDNTVTFRCDHVTSDGEYVIAVVSKNSANVKNYFRVNLEKNTVIVDY